MAKLRYQQTKIDGAPNTILVHAEVVAIIREQQEWVGRYFAEYGTPGKTPRYLFLATQMNRNGVATSLAAGESVVAIAEWLGHDNATLVLAVYGHLMANSEDRMRKAIDTAYALEPNSCAPGVPQRSSIKP